ncbi:UvrD-helicase domain-containing protein [Thermus amyloliquefaciens]|uniref:UvrD-helicase domain-containing protein n=1 Tax=Thermus amyloliquefaciens TaxID=1449080 RepID=UPI00057209F0|nr:UvrD-helicase domain-containing protein [Thermus amyloliquefaciens]
MRLYVASAGTGKTHTLVQELFALLRQGVPLRRMAALTFTRKAAEELRERILEEVRALGDGEAGISAPGPQKGFGHRPASLPMAAPSMHWHLAQRELYGALFTTIHGFMAEALRHTAPFLSLDPDFNVLDEFLAEALFLEEARSLLYLKGLDPGQEGELLDALQGLYKKRSLATAFTPLPGAEGVWALFQEALRRYRARTLDLLGPSDLEAHALRLLENPQAVKRVVERFPHIFLDEYQDVNPLQARFFQALEEAGARVVAVGDPKQSIYLFRNARVEVFRQALARAEVRLLGETFRHAPGLAAFLNAFVEKFFPGPEGVQVQPRREGEGRVEVHWVVGEGQLEAKREEEAGVLARRLLALREEGYAFGDMAVLVRSRSSLPHLERAFRALGVPYGIRRGRSFFRRPEVRDVYHALKVALLEGPFSPEERLSLLAFLRGPFLGLDLGQVEEALRQPNPLDHLPPEVKGRLGWLRELAGKRPLEALKTLVRDETFLKRLSARARTNLDTLLLLAASERFPDLEALLEWLRARAQDPEAAELPEGSEGVNVLTVHAAKGLEWPVVGVFDLSRGEFSREEPLLVGLGGEVALRGTPAYPQVRQALKEAAEEEALRLLYVALSRARDVLLLTGSSSAHPGPWAKALMDLGLGPDSRDPRVRLHPSGGALPPPSPGPGVLPPPAPYASLALAPKPFPPVYSPSAHRKAEGEPLPLAEAMEGEVLPKFARALGTLVHYALARNLDPEDEGAMGALLLQEVALPFAEGERARLLAEVRLLLRNHRGMLGRALPPLEAREEDHAELPLVLPLSGTVWYGVLDRLYRVGGRWYLDDYKTDREVRPEAYRLQLALYWEAVRRAWGVEAEARLVYLRPQRVHPFTPEELREALRELEEGKTPGEVPPGVQGGLP